VNYLQKKLPIFDFVVYLVFFFAFFVDFFITVQGAQDFLVISTFFLIGFVSFAFLVTDKSMLSIRRIISLFLFLFCYLAPLKQYFVSSRFWSLSSFSSDYFAKANFLILIFISIYYFSDIFFKKINLKSGKESHLILNKYSALLLTILSIVSFLVLLSTHSLLSGSDDSFSISSQENFNIVFVKLFRFFPIASLLCYIYSYQSNHVQLNLNQKRLFLLVNIIVSVAIFNPLAGTISRYLLFGTYIAILSALFPKNKHPSLFLLFSFIGFLVVFPTFNFFKYHSILDISELRLIMIDLTSNDYDAYYMSLYSIFYVEKNGFMYGANLLSAFFSFIPRTVWPGKSLASGEIVASYFSASFTNVSCPVFAEYYLSFGISGITFFTVLFSGVTNYIEKKAKGNSFLFKGINSILIGLIFPIMRGSLLPMFSFLYTLLVDYFLAAIILWLFSPLKFGVVPKTSRL
jgi:oligosaccharide repeat unit polymerase